MDALPVEMLYKILKLLPLSNMIRCREVCRRWMHVVDGVTTDGFWSEMCKREHDTVYEQARVKSNPSLLWSDLYKSLYLWRRMGTAVGTVIPVYLADVTAAANDTSNNGFQALQTLAYAGNIISHQETSVVYYNADTFKEVKTVDIGPYHEFEETNDYIIYSVNENNVDRFNCQIRIIPKVEGVLKFGEMIRIENVNNFIIFKGDIYYDRDLDDNDTFEVSICRVKDEFKSSLIWHLESDEKPLVYGHSNNVVNILTINKRIYKIINEKLIYSDMITHEDSFSKLYKYGLLERAVFGTSLRCLAQKWFYGVDVDIIINFNNNRRGIHLAKSAVHLYGDYVLLAHNDGRLQIYNRADFCSESEIIAEPINEFRFYENEEISNEIITSIDVIEKGCEHMVLIAMDNNILTLRLSH